MWPEFLKDRRIPLAANLPARRISVDNSQQWLDAARVLRASEAQLLTMWGADDRDRDGCFRIYSAYLLPHDLLVVEHVIEETSTPAYPSLATLFPAAERMQRGIHDLLGFATDDPDTRNWLRHGGWPESLFPLRRDVDAEQYPVVSEPYPFVLVEGDGVHEIAVGPVHAGTIEPGHFRFSVVGEKVLRLEERLGYTHKGVAKRFEGLSQTSGHQLAARLSGDSAVAFSWAYCAALESIAEIRCSARALTLRALALEHERIANHLGDLGALGNDAGFAFGLTQFSRLKEDLLRTNVRVFGARYLFDFVVPGGVAVDLPEDGYGLLVDFYFTLQHAVAELRTIYDEHDGLQDRFRESGRLEQSVAQKLGATGLVGRASGIAQDLRVDHPFAPYDQLEPNLIVQPKGDVAARVQVRFDEVFESIRLCHALLREVPSGPIQQTFAPAAAGRLGIGLIEGWRGPVMIALEAGAEGTIRRCHAHDPSWQNWPLLEYAILDNIVPDFPLINKSFNLSYSGQDG
ncbi:MAG TPA: NADH-quinone oxidoreductase subunit C [Acidisarcina sp.]|nr:NADH-quinone oxidoreductase subunit C [Acidisarcina sp.]